MAASLGNRPPRLSRNAASSPGSPTAVPQKPLAQLQGQLQGLSQLVMRDIHRGIFAQTFLAIIAVALVPTLGLLIANQKNANQQTRALETAFETAAIATGLQVDHWLETNRLALQQAAHQPSISAMDTLTQEPTLKSLTQTYDWTYLSFAVGPDGYMSGRSDGEEKPVRKWDGSKAFFQGDRAYIQQVVAGASLGNELLIEPTTELPSLCLSAPIHRTATIPPALQQSIIPGDRVGVLVSCSHLNAIAEAINQTQVGETGIAILVDGQNRVIAHGGAIRVNEQLEDFSRYPALKDQVLEQPTQFSWRGHEVTAYVKPVGLEGWKLIIQQNTAEANRPLILARWHALVLLSSTGGLTLLIAYLFSRQLVRPIKSLTQVADAVSRGQLDSPIQGTERQDEIGALARSVKRLATSVAIAFDELEPPSANS